MNEVRRPRSISVAYLLDLLRGQLDGLVAGEWRPLDIVDLGGGTGGIASALAADGHRVTVIDPSPDALASLERRATESALTARLIGRQGDAADLVDLIGVGQVDAVLCHRVLEVVDSPDEALVAIRTVLRPGGALSLLVAQRLSLVLTQALAGHLSTARRILADPSRFDHDQLVHLVTECGFAVRGSYGIGAVSDHVHESVLMAEPDAHAQLAALDAEVSGESAFRALAPQVQIFAQAD